MVYICAGVFYIGLFGISIAYKDIFGDGEEDDLVGLPMDDTAAFEVNIIS